MECQGLLDVHANFEDFRCVEQGEPERSVPKVFPLNSSRKPAGERVVVDRQSFQRNYELFTENLLRDLDWSSVFAAGGSALACLQRLPPECDTNRKKRKYMHDKGFPGSDIDLFLYGLSAEEAKAKILEIYDTVCGEQPHHSSVLTA